LIAMEAGRDGDPAEIPVEELEVPIRAPLAGRDI